MSQKQNVRWSDGKLFFLALFLMFACALFHIKCALSGHPLYRDQHLGTALEYYKTKIDLLRPIIVGFNANKAPMPQEFPVWQALVALFFKVFGSWFGWANVVSLLSLFSALIPLYGLARPAVGQRAAAWTLVFFLSQKKLFGVMIFCKYKGLLPFQLS